MSPAFPNEASEPIRPRTDVRTVALTILAVGAVIAFLRVAREVVIPFLLSGMAFYVLKGPVNRLEHLRVPRAVGAALVLVAAIGAAGVGVYTLADNAATAIADLPETAREFRQRLESLRGGGPVADVQQAAEEMDRAATEATTPPQSRANGVQRVRIDEPLIDASNYLWWTSVGLFSAASQLTIVVFLTYFMLLAGDRFKQKIIDQAGPRLRDRMVTVETLDDISSQLTRFIRVLVLTGLIVGLTTAVALGWLGLEYAVLWGIAAGVLNAIPYVGPLLVTIGLTVAAFAQFGTLSMTAATAGIALAITTLEGWLLTPALMGRALQLNHIAVFGSLLFWGWMWGFWGLLLAVPILAVVKTTCDHLEGWQPVGDFLGE